MSKTLLLICGHLLIPTMSGILFLLLYLYFRFAREAKTSGLTFFRGFLLTMSLYLFGRAVQVLSGPFPAPMIVVSVRLFIQLAICFPCAYLAASHFGSKESPRNVKLAFAVGLLLSFLFSLFHVLGNDGHYVIGRINEITLYGTKEPAFKAPFYGREVTVLIQGLTGIVFIGLGVWRNTKKLPSAVRAKFPAKFTTFYTGMILFGLALFIGCMLKTWVIFYFSSLPCALIIAWGVFQDIRERYDEGEKVKLQLREELLRNLHSMSRHPDKLERLMTTVGMVEVPNSVTVINFFASDLNKVEGIAVTEQALSLIDKRIETHFSTGKYLAVPAGLGVTVLLACSDKKRIVSMAEELCEQLSAINQNCIVGIGSVYDRVQDLWRSREEAEKACEWAVDEAESMVLHIDDLLPSVSEATYPFRERTRLIEAVKAGLESDALQAFEELQLLLTSQVAPLSADYRGQLQEISFLCKETVAESIGDRMQVEEKHRQFCKEIAEVDSVADMTGLFRNRISDFSKLAASVASAKTHNAVTFAKEYVEENFKKQLKIQELAEQVHISPSYYRSLFSKYAGVSFGQFLIDTRVRKAKEMLADPNMTISEVAYEVGYADSNYFSTLFKKNEGVSPTAYRKKVLG